MSRATKNYMKKSIERLHGIIEGISIDYEVNDKEIIALKNWIDTHEFMKECEPFKGLNHLLSEILEDGVIDEQEREDLLDWCADTTNDQGFLKDFTQIVRRLHGIFSGVICDRTIKTEELEGLKDWLLDYEDLQGWWPFNELHQHIKTILKDGRIDAQEQAILQTFFSDFIEQIIDDPNINDEEYWLNEHVQAPCLIFKPIASICEKKPNIIFKDKRFCFTGPAASGKRKDLFQIIEQFGGSTHNVIVKNLDYLIIGAQSSPAWVYSTYGRKIETVMERNKQEKKFNCKIIKEYDFVCAVKNVGGENIIPDPNKPLF